MCRDIVRSRLDGEIEVPPGLFRGTLRGHGNAPRVRVWQNSHEWRHGPLRAAALIRVEFLKWPEQSLQQPHRVHRSASGTHRLRQGPRQISNNLLSEMRIIKGKAPPPRWTKGPRRSNDDHAVERTDRLSLRERPRRPNRASHRRCSQTSRGPCPDRARR